MLCGERTGVFNSNVQYCANEAANEEADSWTLPKIWTRHGLGYKTSFEALVLWCPFMLLVFGLDIAGRQADAGIHPGLH